MTRFSRAKDLVVQDLASIVPELFGGGKKQTRHARGSWQVANRWRTGADMSEMKVWPGGAFKDFAGDARGDAMDLVAYGLTGAINRDTRMLALEWAENRFGIRQMDPAALAAMEKQGQAKRAEMAEQAATDLAQSRDRARKAFYAGQKEILGTPVEIYARSRGVDLRTLPNLGSGFRYRADTEYWPGKPIDDDGVAVGPAPRFEAMLSAMVDGAGQLGAIHYTFFEPGGVSKLDTLGRGWFDEKPDGRRKGKSAKLMFPETSGLVVRVTRGPSNLNCEAAAAEGVKGWFGITEGIEDGWSIGLSDSALRMHAAGSLSGYLTLPDHAAASGYLLFRDNDWDKPQAVELFDKAFARLKTFGKPVEAVAMPGDWGKDANEVLNWKG